MRLWMRRLAEHHASMRKLYPQDSLVVMFDVDDTILDLRHMILHVLRSFDRHHGTGFFSSLRLNDIIVSEREVHRIIMESISTPEKQGIVQWFTEHSWSATVIREAHGSFPGVMEVIRWLQLQKNTSVGLNTGRPEIIRDDTLRCLNGIGKRHGVVFDDHLLFMNPRGWNGDIIQSKVEGMAYFQERGYRIAAFVDNEPENLQAVANSDQTGEILLLHADTVFQSERETLPENAVSGNVYDIRELMRARPADELGRVA